MSVKRTDLSVLLCLVFLLFSEIGWGNQGIGKALDQAMKSRATSPIEEVIANFQAAAGETTSHRQKANVLGLLADFLMEKQEWNKAIEIDEKIIAEGPETDKTGAYYGAAQAYLMLNQPEQARAMCAALKANSPDTTRNQRRSRDT